MDRCLIWLRRDLRLEDNAALAAAAGGEAVLVYLHSDSGKLELNEGEASQWWLHHALADLKEQVEARGGNLVIVKSDAPAATLLELTTEFGASKVFWNRRYEPAAIALDTEVKSALREQGFEVKSFSSHLLNEPQVIKNKSGKPFQVFTPFWKHCRTIEVAGQVDSATVKLAKVMTEQAVSIDDLCLLPSIEWDKGFYEAWAPTREGGLDRLKEMASSKAKKAIAYDATRDTPSVDGTSQLSAWLHFGQVGVREVFAALKNAESDVHEGYLRQLYWRDFGHHLLFHFPHCVNAALRREYDHFPWEPNDQLAEAWRQGKTGYPIVDAGMRQLWQTGWMHNRVRMIVASFLVKHLLQDWRVGEAWFWDTLVDADMANNVMGWQWCAGCGADASPYFRIFNPITQGEKFDADGEYVKKYVPELAKLPAEYIHQPWSAPKPVLERCGVELGVDYPEPIVDHKEARQSALDAYGQYKEIVSSL